MTDSRRAWIADHRTPLLLTIAGIAGIMLLVRDPLTGGAAFVIFLIAAIAAGLVLVLGLQAGAAGREDLVADPDEGHGIVGGHP